MGNKDDDVLFVVRKVLRPPDLGLAERELEFLAGGGLDLE
jgi:hypothetical protein